MKGEVDIITGYDAKYKEALALAKRLGDGMERHRRIPQWAVPPSAFAAE
jgi:hypothetical protein